MNILNWFVANVQDGEDDCRDYYVNREKLKELVETCKKVVSSLEKSGKKTIQIKVGFRNGEDWYEDSEVFTDTSLAEELLPTQSGFFFGGTEYDDWYLQDCKNTIEMLEPLLEDEIGEYYYSSSW